MSVDTDDDGLFDKEEVEIYKTDPLNSDTDGDTYPDGLEVKGGHNPRGSGRMYDFDSLVGSTTQDNIQENENKTSTSSIDDLNIKNDNPQISSTTQDASSTAEQVDEEEKEEYQDTDGDGLLDSEEKEIGTDPNLEDTDGDGLSDYDEQETYGTDPMNFDTDGDGYFDGQEIKGGYNPLGSGKLK